MPDRDPDIPMWQLYSMAGIAGAVMIACYVTGQAARGQFYAVTALLLAMVVRIFWRLRQKTWFVGLIVILGLAHVIVIEFLFAQNTKFMSGRHILLIQMADFASVYFLTSWLEHQFSRPGPN